MGDAAMATKKENPQLETTSPKQAPIVVDKPEVGELSPEMIAKRAYQIWETRGRPRGTNVEDWLEAEAELKQASYFRFGQREHAES
jgi:hypothetical protein